MATNASMQAIPAGVSESTLLMPAEVAKIFGVGVKTVTRWARSGKIAAIRTLGGHRRYQVGEIRRVIAEMDKG